MARPGAEGLYGKELWVGRGKGGSSRLIFEKMTKEHLTFFKVENFKRFDSLILTDIGQYN